MRVANKLTPETTETKPEHRPQQFQDKTLQLLVPNSKRLGGYTGDTQEHKDLHITSCLHGTKEGKTSTRQIKKGCQHKDLYIYNKLFTWDRKVLDKSGKLVKIARRVVYKAKMKARQSTRQVK